MSLHSEPLHAVAVETSRAILVLVAERAKIAEWRRDGNESVPEGLPLDWIGRSITWRDGEIIRLCNGLAALLEKPAATEGVT